MPLTPGEGVVQHWYQMMTYSASRIMRTTIDIDYPILKELKRLARRERKSLGRLVSDLLARSTGKFAKQTIRRAGVCVDRQVHGRSGRSRRQARRARCNGRASAVSCAIDVNILLYASDADSPMHDRASAFLRRSVSGREVFCIVWVSLMSAPTYWLLARGRHSIAPAARGPVWPDAPRAIARGRRAYRCQARCAAGRPPAGSIRKRGRRRSESGKEAVIAETRSGTAAAGAAEHGVGEPRRSCAGTIVNARAPRSAASSCRMSARRTSGISPGKASRPKPSVARRCAAVATARVWPLRACSCETCAPWRVAMAQPAGSTVTTRMPASSRMDASVVSTAQHGERQLPALRGVEHAGKVLLGLARQRILERHHRADAVPGALCIRLGLRHSAAASTAGTASRSRSST